MNFVLHQESAMNMHHCTNDSIALTITSPPYWNAIDYDVHAGDNEANHRVGQYDKFGGSLDDYLDCIEKSFGEVYRITKAGGFCAIVIGTILRDKKHFPLPMMVTQRMLNIGWEFHQDIIWNKVTGGVKRAGVFIQHPKPGYYYPNIMTEYILVFRKPGEPLRGSEPCMEIDTLFKHDIANNIWHVAPVPPRTINHPCPFPEEIVRRLLLFYSSPDDTVLDPFMGSGQTGVVACHFGRKFIGYDVEQEYIDLAKNRINAGYNPRKNNLIPKYEKI